MSILIEVFFNRFPTAEELRKVTGSFVVMYASDLGLRRNPRAAELLSFVTTDNTILQNLKYWSPGPLLQSLHTMSSSHGKHPEVRAYALRSLDTCDPNEVPSSISHPPVPKKYFSSGSSSERNRS